MAITMIPLTDDEIELAILAVEAFRKHHLDDYDDETRPQIASELNKLSRKLRDA